MWIDSNLNAKKAYYSRKKTKNKYFLLLFVTIGYTHARKQNHWIRQTNSQ
jgi:hypothetical protein